MHLLHLFKESHHLLLLHLLVVGHLNLIVVVISKVGPIERTHVDRPAGPWLDDYVVYRLVRSFDDLDSLSFTLDLDTNQGEDEAEEQE